VLICGESGTGKELLARAIHARSTRSDRPFVSINCGAMPSELLESELFGHTRGSVTGAVAAKKGLFEAGNGGTVFLDEIGEVSMATQVSLLRVLDTSTFRRVGSTTEIRVNVRVLAATNRDLESMVRQGLFREDLYYRLSTITMPLPALRERPTDIDLLVAHFAGLLNERFGFSKHIGAAALDLLRAHEWPGNVRELRHAIEAALIVCAGPEVLPEHLPAAVRRTAAATTGIAGPSTQPLPTLAELERAHIEVVLRATNDHRGRAAEILGISERNLYRKIRERQMVASDTGDDDVGGV
jgi:transcriptional regulator with PAS, ATPase and Fis domain